MLAPFSNYWGDLTPSSYAYVITFQTDLSHYLTHIIMIVLKSSVFENIALPCKHIFKNAAFEVSVLGPLTRSCRRAYDDRDCLYHRKPSVVEFRVRSHIDYIIILVHVIVSRQLQQLIYDGLTKALGYCRIALGKISDNVVSLS